MENADNVEPHKRGRVFDPDSAQDAEIHELREEVKRLDGRIDGFIEKLQVHNERHYLLMGIIATVSFLTGMGIKVLELFKQ